MSHIKKLVFVVVLTFAPIALLAQSTKKIQFIKKNHTILGNSFKRELINDSAAIYPITFKIEISKSKSGKITIEKISANTVLAYQLFPSYKQLANLDYKLVLGDKNKTTFIIPILIVNDDFPQKTKYKALDGSPLIEMKAVSQIINELYTETSKDFTASYTYFPLYLIKIGNIHSVK